MSELPIRRPIPPLGRLREVQHPDLSPLLTHFCDRGRPPGPSVPQAIRNLGAADRLTSILQGQQLQAFTTFSGGNPAVCFTESTLPGIEFLLKNRGYRPWALVFDRQGVYDSGGGPVWYTRPAEYAKLEQLGDPALQSWTVRLDPGSDWLEEQEWRIPVIPPGYGLTPAVSPLTLNLVALIVGDPYWNGAQEREYFDEQGYPTRGLFLPHLPPRLPRWHWNAQRQCLEDVGPLY